MKSRTINYLIIGVLILSFIAALNMRSAMIIVSVLISMCLKAKGHIPVS